MRRWELEYKHMEDTINEFNSAIDWVEIVNTLNQLKQQIEEIKSAFVFVEGDVQDEQSQKLEGLDRVLNGDLHHSVSNLLPVNQLESDNLI